MARRLAGILFSRRYQIRSLYAEGCGDGCDRRQRRRSRRALHEANVVATESRGFCQAVNSDWEGHFWGSEEATLQAYDDYYIIFDGFSDGASWHVQWVHGGRLTVP